MTHHYSSPSDTTEAVRGWFAGRVPTAWSAGTPGPPLEVVVDREEITVTVAVAEPDLPEGTSEAERAAARTGRVSAFREDTRDQRIGIAREAEHRFGRKVAWGARCGDRRQLFTHLSVPVMTRLRQPDRQVLDTLVEAGVARSRSEALAWCVRLVGRHTGDWLAELRAAMERVHQVRADGPDGSGGQTAAD